MHTSSSRCVITTARGFVTPATSRTVFDDESPSPFYDENPFGIYQKVLAGRIDFPRHFDVKAKDLIKRLLTHDRTKRYGCLKNGAEDIKKHKWYKGIDWDIVYRR